jgi:hypothetical protein
MKVEAWLVVEATKSTISRYSSGPYQGQAMVNGMKVKGLFQNKPTLNGNQIAFKIELDIEPGWFCDQGSPTIKADLPAPPPDMQQTVPVTVDMPIKPRGKSQASSVVHRS